MYGKKISPQQRIDKEGQGILENVLPNSKELVLRYTPEINDFGIDGHVQIFRNEQHT